MTHIVDYVKYCRGDTDQIAKQMYQGVLANFRENIDLYHIPEEFDQPMDEILMEFFID